MNVNTTITIVCTTIGCVLIPRSYFHPIVHTFHIVYYIHDLLILYFLEFFL